MKLVRQLFPLIYMFMLILCDYTIDAPVTLSTENEAKKNEIENRFVTMINHQNNIIESMESILKSQEIPTKESLTQIYADLRDMDQNTYQKMSILQQEEIGQRPKGWKIIEVIKRLVSILIFFAIMKMLLFPSNNAPSEAELMRQAQKNFKLSDDEIVHIKKFQTMEDQKDAYKRIYLHKIKIHQQKLKEEQELKELKIKEYFEKKAQGKTRQIDILWELRNDFFAFAEKKGGTVKRFADFSKDYIIKIEQAYEKRMREQERLRKEAEEARIPQNEEEEPLQQTEEAEANQTDK